MDIKNCILEVAKEEVEIIRKSVNLGDEENIQRDVDLVLEWFEKQQHLPRIQIDRKLVERVLVSRKGSVEQTKQKIDMIFTLRNLIPDLAAPRDILHPVIQRTFKAVSFAIMPKLSHDQTRVQIFKFHTDVDSFDLADAVKYVLMGIEYRYKYDYWSGDRYVVDFNNITLGHVTKFYPTVFKNTEIFIKKGYGIRIKGIHYIFAPSFMGKVLNIIKGALSDKLGKRIMVHPTLEDLHQHISKDSLPVDYGGTGPSVEEVTDLLRKEFRKEENRQYLIEQERLKSDERLRIGGQADDDVLGIAGSFKKINVD